MSIYLDPSTNVGLAQFGFLDSTQYVSFDKDNMMYFDSNLDDTVTPPTATKTKRYRRWYMCESCFLGYMYNQLAWVYGKYPPQNPNCKKVGVERVFK